MEGLVKRKMDCVGKDQVGLFYRSGDPYFLGSIEAMELCDEIQRLQIARSLAMFGEFRDTMTVDRSSIVLEALKMYRNMVESMLENTTVLVGDL